MNIAIVGTGYVGLVSGTCFAEMGINVTCVDIDSEKVEKLHQGIIPIYEPGLDEMVRRNVEAGRLKFTTDLAQILDNVEVVFSAVGTPPDEDGSADLKYVLSVAKTFGKNINKYTILVTKSTVPVGTAHKVKEAIKAELDARGVDIQFDVASNPEFLKEGAAIKDFMTPDRVVVGTESEVNMVRKGIGSDSRIGKKFLYPGCGYGGSCFPKDVKALIKTAEKHGYPMRVLKAVEEVNELQKAVLFQKLSDIFDGNLAGKTIAMWGLAFKPETDDMREAPALVLINLLRKAGANVRVYDPVAMNECRRRLGDDAVVYCNDMYEAAIDTDALLVVTEWNQFRMPSLPVLRKTMAQPIIIDGRNIYDHEYFEEQGFKYACIGRK